MSNSEQEIIPTEVNQCFELGEQIFSKTSSSLDKRIRNLEKRRTKLFLLDDERKQGKVLNADQKMSLEKIPVIDGNIEMAKEVIGVLKDSCQEFSSNRGKFVAKKPHPKKEERAPKPPNLSQSFSQLIQFHAVLSSFAKIDTYEKSVKGYADLKLSEDDITHLRAFVELTQLLDYPSLVSLHTVLHAASNHFTLLVESSKDCYEENLSYNRLHKVLLRLLSSSHNMKKLDDMLREAIDLEDSEFAQEDAISPPQPDPPQPAPVPPPEEPVPAVQELIPSQTIVNRSAEPLTEEMFISSTNRLANNTATDNQLIMTTVFTPSNDTEPECVSKPRVLTPETTHEEPTPPAETVFPEPVTESVPTQVISFPGIDLSTVSIEDDFDFLHDSELPVAPAKSKAFPTQQPSQPSIFAPLEAAGSSFMGPRLSEPNYKPRTTHTMDMYPARQPTSSSGHSSNYSDADLMRYGQKDPAQLQHYMRGNQTNMQRPPQQIATSSLAQPFGGMVVENSGSSGRADNSWDNRK